MFVYNNYQQLSGGIHSKVLNFIVPGWCVVIQ